MSAADHRPAIRMLVVAGAVVALLLAAVSLVGDGEREDPYATTPIAEAKRQAKDKDLQVGLAYGGRMSISDTELDAALGRAKRLGARWVRADLVWADVERYPGVYDWSVFDRWVAGANERGLKLVTIVLGAPEWARRADCVEQPNCPPADVDDFADFAGDAAARYGPLGQDTWQIWNEPNIELFWNRPDPGLYAEMLAGSAQAIRSADADATVVFGGLAALPPNSRVIEARAYLAKVCRRGGCEQVDVLAYHPYTYPDLASDPSYADAPWSRIAESEYSLVTVLDRFGMGDVPIWLTEFGAPSGGRAGASDGTAPLERGVVDHVTEKRQAEIAFDAVASAVVTPRVTMLLWYTDIDLPERAGKQAHYGLIRKDGSEKPVWGELRRAMRMFTG